MRWMSSGWFDRSADLSGAGVDESVTCRSPPPPRRAPKKGNGGRPPPSRSTRPRCNGRGRHLPGDDSKSVADYHTHWRLTWAQLTHARSPPLLVSEACWIGNPRQNLGELLPGQPSVGEFNPLWSQLTRS